MRIPTICLLLTSAIHCAMGQECSHLWYGLYSADPLQSKGVSGDTAAAYALFSFKSDPTLRLVIRDKFPKARFMSFQTYRGKLTLKGSFIADHQIKPDQGSENPFVEGNPIQATRRSYTIDVLPKSERATNENTLYVNTKRNEIQSLWYRVYVPTGKKELKQEDMPKIYAYDIRTGEERSCPKKAALPLYLNLPQVLTIGIEHSPEFEFKPTDVGFGPNSAIPSYVVGKTRMERDDIAIIRFRSPSFFDKQSQETLFDTSADVRYWSLCANNVTKNETLNCVPDYVFQKIASSNAMVTVVFGGGARAKEYSESHGYIYLPDTRKPDQKVVVFNYRNILPNPAFKEGDMYRGSYLPTGKLIKIEELSKE